MSSIDNKSRIETVRKLETLPPLPSPDGQAASFVLGVW